MPQENQEDDRTRSYVPLTAGAVIGHYKIIEKIGAGGMGEVYLADDTELDRKVALKFLPPHLSQDEGAKARFTRESQATAKLSHPNIITIHEVSEYQGRPYFAMEHIEGRSMHDVIKSKELTLDQAVNLAAQICEGLSKAHQAGVTHRDIKPSNIVIDTDGRAKLLDFGLATVAGTDKLTKTGSTLGTVGYMSPEQASGRKTDERSDLFSLGVVLYEMITGRRPFKGEDEVATLHAVTHESPEPLARFKAEIPDGLQDVVDRALDKDVETRYPTAAAMLADLRRLRRRSADTIEVTKPGRRFGPGAIALAGLAAIVIVVAGYLIIDQTLVSEVPDKDGWTNSIAVLPFRDFSPNQDQEYFCNGMTDAIIGKLSGVEGLKVISMTSVMRYKTPDRDLKKIGQDLQVKTILEGSIQREDSRIRVRSQLINVADDAHLWSDTYDRELASVFAIQDEIALAIMEQMKVKLVRRPDEPMVKKQTENLDAYNAYLRGRDYMWRPDYTKDNQRLAVRMFERAIELDPDFALAYAELSRAHSSLYHFGYDATERRLSQAKTAADRALALQPALPEAHLALGWYHYWCHREYDEALEALAIAERGLPNDARISLAIGAIRRRQGRFEEALENLKRAFELSPRDAQLAYEIGHTYKLIRRYSEAERYYDRSISLAPDQVLAYRAKIGNYWLWQGDTQTTRAVLEAMPRQGDDEVRELWFRQEVYERNYPAALERLAPISGKSVKDQWTLMPKAQLEGLVYHLMGETALARAAYDSARILLEAEVKKQPDDHRVHSSLVIVYAGLGRKDAAIREGQLGVELFPVAKDASIGPSRVQDLAQIFTMVGEYDDAIDQIEYLLSIPSRLSVPLLRLDPCWDPLRDHPRFQALLEKYEKEHGT